jgi:hypothetical protein
MPLEKTWKCGLAEADESKSGHSMKLPSAAQSIETTQGTSIEAGPVIVGSKKENDGIHRYMRN